MPRRFLLPLAAALFVAAARTLMALSRIDELELERYSANLAWALIKGLPLDPEQLPIISHLRGSFLFGLALVPLELVFGPTVVVLKLLAVATSALAAALATALAKQHLGTVATVAVVLLFAFAPPAYQMVDVLAMGSHVDTVPFLLLPLLLLLRLRSDIPARLRDVYFVGVSVGAAVFFSYQALVALPGWLLVWCLRQPPSRAWLARVPIGLIGCATTAIWIPLVSRDAKVANHAVLDEVSSVDIGAAFAKFFQAVVVDLPQSWAFAGQGVAFAAPLLGGLAVVGWMLACTRQPRSRASWRHDAGRQLVLVGLVHVVALLAAYGFIGLEADLTANLDGMAGRYFLPLWPAFVFAIAHTCQWLSEHTRPAVGWSLVAGVGAVGLWATVPLLAPSKAIAQPTMSAIDMYQFREHVEHASKSPAEQLEWLAKLDPSWGAFWPFYQLKGELALGRGADDLRTRLAKTRRDDAQLVPYLCLAAGARLGARVTGADTPSAQWPNAINKEAAELHAVFEDQSERRWFWRGVGRSLATAAIQFEVQVRWGRMSAEVQSDFLRGLERFGTDAVAVCEGAGFQMGLRASPYQPPEQALLARTHLVAPKLRGALIGAVAWGYRIRFVEASYWPPTDSAFEARLPEHARGAFRSGLDWRGGPP